MLASSGKNDLTEAGSWQAVSQGEKREFDILSDFSPVRHVLRFYFRFPVLPRPGVALRSEQLRCSPEQMNAAFARIWLCAERSRARRTERQGERGAERSCAEGSPRPEVHVPKRSGEHLQAEAGAATQSVAAQRYPRRHPGAVLAK